MALPVSAPPPSSDIAISGWAGITVRIAWTLLAHEIRVNRRVLRDARAHVLYHISPRASLENAEDKAGMLAHQFVMRARGLPVVSRDLEMPISPRWRRGLERSLTPLAQMLLTHHYANNKPLDHLERILSTDRLTIDGCVAGLREIVRRFARNDGVPIDTWTDERLDALLSRLAAYCPGTCPPLIDVIEGAHHEHTKNCVRCRRTLNLIQAGVVDVEDLLAPSLGARPYQESTLLALEFHPEGQAHLPTICRELNSQVQQIGGNMLLVDWADPVATSQLLYMATEIASPHREHIRGVIVEGPGHWTMYGIVGPLAGNACKDITCQDWGKIDRLAKLPDPLPSPPTARGWWGGVFALVIATILAINAGLANSTPQKNFPLEASFTAARGGIWIDFDVHEAALVSVVVLRENQLELLLDSGTAAAKAQLSLGDGHYRLHSRGEGALVTSSQKQLLELPDWIKAANQSSEPLRVLAQSIEESHPMDDVQFHKIP
jgi:hypothetical protein